MMEDGMKQVSVKTATHEQLDWLVAKVKGFTSFRVIDGATKYVYLVKGLDGGFESFQPSTKWAAGGPLLEECGILVGPSPFPKGEFAAGVGSEWSEASHIQMGSDPLTAIVRCYVMVHLGVDVDVPNDL